MSKLLILAQLNAFNQHLEEKFVECHMIDVKIRAEIYHGLVIKLRIYLFASLVACHKNQMKHKHQAASNAPGCKLID